MSISEQTDFWPPRPNEDDGDEENEVDEENKAEEEQDVQIDEESDQGLWKLFKGNRCEIRSNCNINFYNIPASWRLLFPRYERKRKKYNYKFKGGLVEHFDLRKHSTSSFLSTGINFARRVSMKITGNRGRIEHYFQDYEDC